MPYKNYIQLGVRLLYAIIFLIIIVIIGISAYDGYISQKDVATSLLTLIGTFLGATFAFRLNEDKEASKLDAAQRTALNRALFILLRQFNAIQQIKRDLDKFTTPFERALNLPALKTPPYSDLLHNFADLEFVLESVCPNLLFELTIEQERFHQALESFRIRNEFYVNEIQPKIGELGLNRTVVSMNQVAEFLGDRLFEGIMNRTAIAYEHISLTHESLPGISEKLFKYAKEKYPDHKFIMIEKTK